METAKKQSSEWVIALLLAIISAIIAGLLGFLIMFVIGIALVMFGPVALKLTIMIGYIVALASIWLGIRTAASYICKSYSITDAAKIVIRATLLYSVYVIGWALLNFKETLSSFGYRDASIYWASLVLGCVVFYFAGKKYVLNNESQPVKQPDVVVN